MLSDGRCDFTLYSPRGPREARCVNEGRWRCPTLATISDFVWCVVHKHLEDEPVPAPPVKRRLYIPKVTVLVLALLFAPQAWAKKPSSWATARVSPSIASIPAGQGAVYATVRAEITGPVIEENYCLGVDVEWPERTHSARSFDCDPFEQFPEQLKRYDECLNSSLDPGHECSDPTPERRWTFGHWFGPGDQTVTVRFTRSEKTVQAVSVTIRVVG